MRRRKKWPTIDEPNTDPLDWFPGVIHQIPSHRRTGHNHDGFYSSGHTHLGASPAELHMLNILRRERRRTNERDPAALP